MISLFIKQKSVKLLSAILCFIFLSLSSACDEESEPNITDRTVDPIDKEGSMDDLGSLPIDSGGKHSAKPLGSTKANFGYYVYTPSGHGDKEVDYPLLVFLHGTGEKGNSKVDPSVLKKVLNVGPPRMIEKGIWSPKHPMIVASPQLTSKGWNPDELHSFIKYLIDNYDVNSKRIYLTGLSLGAIGTFAYINKKGSEAYPAAVVPIAGSGWAGNPSKFNTIPVWAFHGDKDTRVPTKGSKDMIKAINSANPRVRAKLTIYPGVGHNSWRITYTGSGMGQESKQFDPFNQSIYTWMLQYLKE